MADKKKKSKKKFVEEPKSFTQNAKAFGTARMSKLSGYGGKYGTSTGTAREAEKLYLGMVEYARLYGFKVQYEAIKKMNPAKLRWMYRSRYVVTEEYFAYDPTGSYVLDTARANIQLVIDRYTALNKEANRIANERKKARRGDA